MHYDSFTNGLSSLKPPLMKTVNESVHKRCTTLWTHVGDYFCL